MARRWPGRSESACTASIRLGALVSRSPSRRTAQDWSLGLSWRGVSALKHRAEKRRPARISRIPARTLKAICLLADADKFNDSGFPPLTGRRRFAFRSENAHENRINVPQLTLQVESTLDRLGGNAFGDVSVLRHHIAKIQAFLPRPHRVAL